jgi:N-methylhydantoinase A/oxoprolinase/acetone carboxylase beta subunit
MWRMAFDIGGTFTDFVLADAGGYGNPAAIKRDLAMASYHQKIR